MRTYYYSDPLHDDFAGTDIRTKPLKKKYRYIHTGALWRFAEAFLYRLAAQPLAFLYLKLHFGQRFADRRCLRKARGSGLYIYANHTNALLDAFCPNIARPSRRTHIIAGPDTMSIPGIGNLVEMLGVIPLGSTSDQKLAMEKCVFGRAAQGRNIVVYPEAHIWPYYTGIRPFPAASFRFPARDGLPVYAMTNCYRARRFAKRPRVETYLDGPFYADKSLSERENRVYLRDLCYNAMVKRAEEHSDCEYCRYVRKDAEDESEDRENG